MSIDEGIYVVYNADAISIKWPGINYYYDNDIKEK